MRIVDKKLSGHPGGIELTQRMLDLSGIAPPARMLDLGAGSGQTVDFLREIGFDAWGIDLQPSNNFVSYGDACQLPFAEPPIISSQTLSEGRSAQGVSPHSLPCVPAVDDSLTIDLSNDPFDAVIAECMLSVSGDASAVFKTAFSLLKPKGLFIISDVVFEGNNAPCLSFAEPLTEVAWFRLIQASGFNVVDFVDVSELWRDYYLRSLWAGQEVFYSCKTGPDKTKQGTDNSIGIENSRCGYMMMVCQKNT